MEEPGTATAAATTPLDGSLERPVVPATLPEGACCAWHADAPATFVCDRCGNFGCANCLYFLRESRNVCVTCGPRDAIPWERRRELGWWKAFWQTTKLASRRPTQFFRTPSLEPGAMMPVAYGTVAYTVGRVMQALELGVLLTIGLTIVLAVAPSGSDGAGAGAGAAAIGFGVGILYSFFLVAMTLLQAPVTALFWMFVGSALTHLTLYLMKRNKGTFEGTLRVVAYAYAGHAYEAVPIIGGLIALVWTVVVEVVGIRETHQCSTGAAVFSVLAWRILSIGVILALYAALVGVLFAAGGMQR